MCDYLSAFCWCHSFEHVLYGIDAHGKQCLFVNLILGIYCIPHIGLFIFGGLSGAYNCTRDLSNLISNLLLS